MRLNIEIDADEGALQALAALLLYAKIKPVAPAEAESPFAPDLFTALPPEPPADVEAAREEAFGLLRSYIERHGVELGKNLLHEFAATKISEVEPARLPELIATLKKSLPRRA